MKIVSFNVNSVRIRLHQLAAVIDKYQPDFIGLQETKATDEDFPEEAINDLGYHVVFHGQKTHYGVALLSKSEPVESFRGFAGDNEYSQKRVVGGSFTTRDGTILSVINGYFPQGESRKHATKFPAKEKFYSDLTKHIKHNFKPDDLLFVIGDMNVAPVDEDIGIGADNKKRWLSDGKTSFLPEEREWLTTLGNWGLADTFRHLYPEIDDRFSWFDYRSKGFEREPKRGLRIDLIMASKGAMPECIDAGIDYDIRGMEKPSDHCPIWAEFSIQI